MTNIHMPEAAKCFTPYSDYLIVSMHEHQAIKNSSVFSYSRLQKIHKANVSLLDSIQMERMLRSDMQIGDIIFINDSKERVARIHDNGTFQTSKGSSFFIDSEANAKMAGSLGPIHRPERVTDSRNRLKRYNRDKAKFWTYCVTRGQGKGNGIFFTLRVNVWSLQAYRY